MSEHSRRLLRVLDLLALVVAAGCAVDPVPVGTISEDDDFEYVAEGDFVIPVHKGHVLFAGSGPTSQVGYLNFDGAPIRRSRWAQNNAQTTPSSIPPHDVQSPAFDAAPWGSRSAAISTSVSGLQQDFSGYQVTFTASRPASGPYTMVMVGGSSEVIGFSDLLGIAPR